MIYPNTKMHNLMKAGWREWVGKDLCQDMTASYQRGFLVAHLYLIRTIAELVELMERSDKAEFKPGEAPVSSAEWFDAIDRAKTLLKEDEQ